MARKRDPQITNRVVLKSDNLKALLSSDEFVWPAIPRKGRMCSIQHYEITVSLHEFEDCNEIRAEVVCSVFDSKDISIYNVPLTVIENAATYIDALVLGCNYAINHYMAHVKNRVV